MVALAGALFARSADAADAPQLPGIATDVIAAAEEQDQRAHAAPAESWWNADRVLRWTPGVVLLAAGLAVDFAAEPPRDPRWDSRNSFDDGIQDALGGDSRSTRDAAATASTVLLAALGAGYAADIYFLRDDYDVEQSLMVGLTMTAGDLVVTETAKVAAGRERPYVRECRTNPGYSDSCISGRDDNASFFSAHASESATLAGLVCVRRLRRRDVTWRDRLLCGAAVATSATTGILRISAEEHYATDVLAGWGTGAVFGAAIPLLFPRWSGLEDDDSSELTPLAGAQGLGLQYTHRF